MNEKRYHYYEGKQRYALHMEVCRYVGHRTHVEYSLRKSGSKTPIFEGEDYSPSPLYRDPVGRKSANELMGCLLLRPGDTDDEHFEGYTKEQLRFAETEADYIILPDEN